MNTIAQAKRYIDSFARPIGYNNYAWNVAKKMALEVWDCYLTGRTFRKSVNYFHNDFYKMIQTPEGDYILPKASFRAPC